MADEVSLLETFADLAELTRNRPVDEDRQSELRVHSSREHFHTYLQSLDVERGGLPEQFRERLVRVLRHYGVEGVDRTPELEDAVFRIFLAQQRTTPEVALVSALLGSWSRETPPTGELAARARGVLERLGRVPQSRYPAVGDLARSVRFRWFDQPAVDAERSDILLGVRDELAALAASDGDRSPPTGPGASTPSSPSPSRSCASWPSGSSRGSRLVSRCWRCWPGATTASTSCTTSSSFDTRRAAGRGRELHPRRATDPAGLLDRHRGGAGRPLSELVTSVASSRRGARSARGSGRRPLPALARRTRHRRRGQRPAARRCCPRCRWPTTYDVSAWPSAPAATAPVGYYVFRPAADGSVVEDDLTRGVHPMVGRRLDLWRLRNFHVTRVEAPEDVLLYECVARENPSDRRLVALAQVRQMSVVRDEDGTITALPHAERAVENCLESIRRERVARGTDGAKLDMNHVWVHVWPVVDLDLDAPGRARHQDQPADRRRRHRGGRRPGAPGRPRRRPGRAGRALRRPAGSRHRLHRRGAADRAAQAARRLRLQGGPLAPSRARLPLRAERRARRSRRHARRARPRRHRPAGAGRPALRPQQGRHPRRRRHARRRRCTPRA